MNHNSVPLTVQLVKTVKSAEIVEDTSSGQKCFTRPKLKRRRYGNTSCVLCARVCLPQRHRCIYTHTVTDESDDDSHDDEARQPLTVYPMQSTVANAIPTLICYPRPRF
jgi:hypothetical protein